MAILDDNDSAMHLSFISHASSIRLDCWLTLEACPISLFIILTVISTLSSISILSGIYILDLQRMHCRLLDKCAGLAFHIFPAVS